MGLFGKKGVIITLSSISIVLLAYTIWQFAIGGRSAIQTNFVPVNDQMKELLAQTAPSPAPRSSTPPSSPAPTPVPSSPALSSPAAGPTLEPKPDAAYPSPSAAPAAAKNGLLDLNSATLEQLDELPGIGASKAKAILEYREKKGRFQKVEELAEVKGIGKKMLEKLKPYVYAGKL